MCLAIAYWYFLGNIRTEFDNIGLNRKRTTCNFDANFSGTCQIGWLVAANTRVAFDRGRQCRRDVVVAQIRITGAFCTEKLRRTTIFRMAWRRSAPTGRTWYDSTWRSYCSWNKMMMMMMMMMKSSVTSVTKLLHFTIENWNLYFTK